MPVPIQRSGAILIVGATGAFGARLADRLAASVDSPIVLDGRSDPKLRAAAAVLRGRHATAHLGTLVLDRDRVHAALIKSAGAMIVVDAAGPFQNRPPALAHAAIAAGAHHIDLADARDLIRAFPALDAEARTAGILTVTGASSTPALSQAALDRITQVWRNVDTVAIAIMPGTGRHAECRSPGPFCPMSASRYRFWNTAPGANGPAGRCSTAGRPLGEWAETSTRAAADAAVPRPAYTLTEY